MTYVLNLLKYRKSSFVITYVYPRNSWTTGGRRTWNTSQHTIKGSTIIKVWVVASLSRVWTHVAFVRARALIFTLALNHTDTTDITANTLTYLSANAPLLFKHGYCFSVYVQLPLLYKTHIISYFTKTKNKYKNVLILINLCIYNIIRCTKM